MTSSLAGQNATAQLGVGATGADVTEWFRQQLLASLSDPLFNLPKVFLTYLADYIATSGLNIPIGQITGYTEKTGLTGIFDGAGAISGGSGFTVVRVSAGKYTVTFDSPFGQRPVVHCQIVDSGVNARVAIISATTNASFTVEVVDTAGTHADVGILFSAFPVV